MWSGAKGSEVYPRTFFDWAHLSRAALLAAFRRPCRMIMEGSDGVDWLILVPEPGSSRP